MAVKPFVFIVGCPRSGTTLLQRIVDAHPAIAVVFETHWIPRLSLRLHLYDPQKGTVYIDGVNVKGYKRKSLQRQIGIVFQESVLFGATIEEIIAASAANAHDFTMELEDGYTTVIGERGDTLSGGQRQRIVIARAVVRNAPILMLDEPMTGLGVESKAKVQEAIDRLVVGKTYFLITHDLHTVADADLILVIQEGRIVERGTHGELITGHERYHQLHELKLGRHEESVRDG